MVTYILAGTSRQAYRYAEMRDLGADEWRYIREARVVIGLDRPRVVKTGTWWERDDATGILRALEARGADLVDDPMTAEVRE